MGALARSLGVTRCCWRCNDVVRHRFAIRLLLVIHYCSVAVTAAAAAAVQNCRSYVVVDTWRSSVRRD